MVNFEKLSLALLIKTSLLQRLSDKAIFKKNIYLNNVKSFRFEIFLSQKQNKKLLLYYSFVKNKILLYLFLYK